MEAKAAFVITLAREVVVDTGRGRRGGAVVPSRLCFALSRRDGPGWYLALPGGPLGNLGIDAGQNSVQPADAEEQQPLGRGRQGGEMHLQRCCLVFCCKRGAAGVVHGAFMIGHGRQSAERPLPTPITLKGNQK